MGRTDRFIKQHDELLEIVREMSGLMDINKMESNAKALHLLLSKLAGKLKLHLAIEDKNLYPSLLSSKDSKVKSMAEKYISEMGGLAEVFMDYVGKWSNASMIKEKPAEFIKETKGVFSAVGKRIDKENNELYPLFEKVGT